ncbi:MULTISPECIES: hypothetical protein [unclassified Photobacterium]|uniref:hypothetical protein n=1 Tax=unclassified Photobacterium TaxID=2628852 RepID=UPI001EDD505D|nr:MULTISPECIES: hypothetical protein [unclassified Photobacterium]MCG3865193.1 hypothetical protein [Photobacterium sp. Ph6]MCG3876692.1 hypothetical protein [Photobacterium sp. Ph5]
MNFKLSLLATSLSTALLLSGCGGGDSSIEDKIKDAITETVADESITITGAIAVKVIDGYLTKAEICVDKNNNSICEADEKLDTLTDENGQLEITEENRQYPLIANVIAGKSSDTDRVGKSVKSYSMTATAGKTVITPFTTLASIQNLTIDELAAKYNLDSSVISGDYIEAKKAEDTKESAVKAHALARSIANQLDETISATKDDIDTINKNIEKVSSEIDNLINNDKLDVVDNTDFNINDGDVSQVKIINELKPYLENGGEWYYLREGYDALYKITFEKNQKKYYQVGFSEQYIESYSISKNKLYVNNTQSSSYIEGFLYLSDNFSLTHINSNDNILLLTKNNLESISPIEINISDLINNNHYFIFNDDDYGVDESFAQLKFSSDNSFTSTEDGNTESGSWSIVDYTLPDTAVITKALELKFPDEEDKTEKWILLEKNDDAMVFGSYTTSESHEFDERSELHLQGFSFHNKNTATSIFNQWKYGETLINDDLKKHIENDQYWYSASFNKSKYNESGFDKLIYKNGTVSGTNKDDSEAKSTTYTIEDNKISYTDINDADISIYNSDSFDLRVDVDVNDLILNTTTDLQNYKKIELTAEDFSEQKWNIVFDSSNSSNTILPSYNTFKYKKDGSYSSIGDDQTPITRKWDIVNGSLTHKSSDSNLDETFIAITKDKQSMILANIVNGKISIRYALFKESYTAKDILKKWNYIKNNKS